MSSVDPAGNGETQHLDVTEFIVVWDKKKYRINANAVLKAFGKSGYKNLMGPNARYFLAIDGDLKPVEAVLRSIVPIAEDEINPRLIDTISEALRALGFEILDRHKHHE